ncbi:hypothetical protein CR513_29051, partial [Mucuna pruriens]
MPNNDLEKNKMQKISYALVNNMVVVTHFNLELYQMDVKIVFLNCDIDITIYIMQSENFVLGDSKSIFHQAITSIGFKENVVNNYVYHKLNGSKYMFLVLYIDGILLASNNIDLLHEIKRFSMKNIKMKDHRKFFVLGIYILRYHSYGIPKLSQHNYINKILDKFSMKDNKLGDISMPEGDQFSLKQYPIMTLKETRCKIFHMH